MSDGMAQAFTVLNRYHAVARAMGARAVRGACHCRGARCPQRAGFRAPRCGRACRACRSACCRALQEAEYSAEGVLCGIPTADGILADIGGGSLEVVRLDAGTARRIADAAARRDPAGRARGRRPGRARARSPRRNWRDVPWLAEGAGARSLPGRRRLARAGAHPHGADRLSAADGASLHDRPRGGARPGRA